jgi:hypothetical protein
MVTGHVKKLHNCYSYILFLNPSKPLFSPLVSSRFLDAAGMKNSKAYLVNGAAMVVTWLVNTGPKCISFDLVASIYHMNFDRLF